MSYIKKNILLSVHRQLEPLCGFVKVLEPLCGFVKVKRRILTSEE